MKYFVSGMWSYKRNQWSKQTNLADLQFLSNYVLFSKNWCGKLLKRKIEYQSILYNSRERPVDWTSREFQDHTILFSSKIKTSIQRNPEVTVSYNVL